MNEGKTELMKAVEIAVRKAYIEAQREEKRKERNRTMYHTRRLMEEYRTMKGYLEAAISEEEEVNEKEYDKLKGKKTQLGYVRESKMATAMTILNIEKAMDELKEESQRNGTWYKYKAFEMHYMDGMSYEEIADKLNCGKNSPANWSKTMLRKMAVKLFGVKGI